MCEMPDIGTITSKHPVARKDYKCCECGRLIKKGNKYWYFEAVWLGIDGWDNFKTCLRCENLRSLARDKFHELPWSFDPPFGELYEWIRESRR